MPIAPFPHVYEATLDGDLLRAGERTPIVTGSPSQFGGTDDVWSPELLLIAAIVTCLKTTFDAFARRESIAVHAWRAGATGVLVKSHEGPVFDSIDIDVTIVTEPGDEERARVVLGAAERHCIITRAVTAPTHVKADITASRTAAAS